MNIETANTEPFYRFHRFHEEFNRNIKVAFGALQLLGHSASAEVTEGSKLVILPTGGEPWGDGTKWRSLAPVSSQASKFLSQMGLVRVMSAFEDFLTNVKAEHDRYANLPLGTAVDSPKLPEDEDDSKEVLVRLFAQLGWDMKPIAFLVPLFDYFSIARNCVVHRSARASEALVEQAQSSALAACLAAWPSARGKKLPTLPNVEQSREIPFLPRHSILASEVCYRAAEYVNTRLASFLGESGIVYMAAHHTLLADERIPTAAKNSADRIVNYALAGRYRVVDLDPLESVKLLKQLDCWRKCLRRYEKLYPKAVAPKRKS
jgi:hypothetical protein